MRWGLDSERNSLEPLSGKITPWRENNSRSTEKTAEQENGGQKLKKTEWVDVPHPEFDSGGRESCTRVTNPE